MRITRLLGLGLILAVAGCQTGADLEPAPGADTITGLTDAAENTVQGVEVTAQAVDWPGPREISRQVTPIRVVITNKSIHPLRVRYQEFALVDNEGRRYSALPPWEMEGSVTEEMTARYTAPVAEPLFTHRGFHIAPAYRTVYPAWDTWAGPFAYDRWYYDSYATYWREVPLPTDAMRSRGLPEGVLDPGEGRLEGWLFFERVDGDRDRVVFRYDLVDAEQSREFGELRIPFTVN